MKLILFLILCIYLTNATVIQEKYIGYKVYRLYPVTEEQQIFLKYMENEDKYDFWSGLNKIGRPIDIMVGPTDRLEFLDKIYQYNIKVEVLIEDVQRIISEEKIGNFKMNDRMDWMNYWDLEDIYDWMESLAVKYPHVEIINVGKTFENRDLKGIKISYKPGKRNVIIEGGIHAREWISPATLTFLINELVDIEDTTLRKIAESFDWYIFPVLNPDGYAYTHTTDRMWRKNRTPYNPSVAAFCVGSDSNRNWDYEWGIYGTSTNSCSGTYGGPKPFSELEINDLANYFKTIGPNTDVYLAFHSYSQYLLIPYATKVDHQDNYDDLFEIGKKAIQSLANRYETVYVQGTAAEILYEVSGSSADWMKDQFKIPITYTYELRDKGRFGFLLPADQIIPNCLEIMDSIVTIFLEAEKMGYFSLD